VEGFSGSNSIGVNQFLRDDTTSFSKLAMSSPPSVEREHAPYCEQP
jgi:hypothetical protein